MGCRRGSNPLPPQHRTVPTFREPDDKMNNRTEVTTMQLLAQNDPSKMTFVTFHVLKAVRGEGGCLYL